MKMKRILMAIGVVALLMAFAWPAWTVYYDIYGTNALIKGNLLVIEDTITAGLYIEGDTADAYETKIAGEDPTADRIATLPDYDGAVPIIVDQSGATSTCNSGTSDIPDSTVTPAVGWWVNGKTLKWEIAGAISGQNAAKHFKLSVGDTDILDLATAANAEGDYKFTCTVYRGDDTISGVTEIAEGTLIISSGDTNYYADYGTSGITNFASGGTSFRVRATSGHANDQIFTNILRIWHWFKS